MSGAQPTAADIGEALRGRPSAAGGWSACCPAHDDATPSLSIRDGDRGRVLVHCHSPECSQAAVITALKHRGLWADAPTPDGASEVNGSHKPAPKTLGTPIAHWFYEDSDGKQIVRVTRFEVSGDVDPESGKQRKSFRQFTPDGRGGWKPGLSGLRPPLYRLPELRAAPTGSVVYVVEGEAKAELLRGWGLTATTSIMGAEKFRPEHADELVDRNVVILPDHDDAGRKHCALIVGLLTGRARTVKVLELPGLPHKGDVIDWQRAGGAAAELTALTAAIHSNGVNHKAAAEPSTADNSYSTNAPYPNGHDEVAARHPGVAQRRSPDNAAFAWPEPLDFFTDPTREAPDLRHDHIPDAINDFVFDVAGRMGVDPTSVALCSITACAAVVSDEWKVQPKRLDDDWTESPRLWALIVGPPSSLKSPIITACTRPIDKIDEAARKRYAEEMRAYKQELKGAKSDPTGETAEPRHPKLDRYLVENATVDALTEVLRDDDDAHQRAPAGKVLSRQDEMSEFVANFDRYRSGGSGGGDRGAYLRSYNGGRNVVDRIGRGSFAVPNWSICLMGGIQPGPIQKIAKGAAEDGLLQRPFYCVPGPQVPGVDRKPSAEARRRYQNLFPALAALHPPRTQDGEHVQIVVFHEDAHQHRELVDRWARAMSLMPDASPQLLSSYGKWAGQFARLALIFHLIELADARAHQLIGPSQLVISAETAKRAADYMIQIALPHLLRAYRAMFLTAQTTHAAWIAGYILAERCERITSRDITRVYGALRAPEDRDELAAVMAQLTVVGWLEPEVPNNPARPVHAWAVNPAVHDRFARHAELENERRRKAREDLAFLLAMA